MTEGPILLIMLIISIMFIVIMTSKIRVHPFMVLLLAAIGTGLSTGLPMQQLVIALKSGFGDTFGRIGIVINAGTIISVRHPYLL